MNESWRTSRETIDKLSKAQPEFNYEEEKIPSFILPDVLTSVNRKKITQNKEWMNLRRPEVLELFTSQVYGRADISVNTIYPFAKS